MIKIEQLYIKLWIGNLGKYNEGYLVGEWFDLPCDMSEVAKVIGLNAEYEEWQINDYETNIEGLEIHHFSNIEALNEFAERLDTLKEYEVHILNAYIQEFGHDNLLDIFDSSNFRDAHVHYGANDMSDIVYALFQDGYWGELPEMIRRNIDFKSLGEDWGEDGTYVFLDGGICVEFPY